ncbi:NADP-dependent malic enzyme [Brevundimonas fontaquae]|uniref:NADP-dependent malic enzyme n=1 Tax=Brevundimonas fontaquae TaxID=2813778 RepID=A0ABX7LQV6_9CAUL|nr:NADP-dependent malic enzyme [Brevundimonas fontaquae]QSF55157.1 NADP-dependent malic enzyme [Brevundimonas fontaquae]
MTPQDRRARADQEALDFHRYPAPGKVEVNATKPMATQRDLSLAYSPGVAAPVRAIADDPSTAYDYTSKGNLVGVISNGTAILGLGNLGALASKPVMEGKAILFKRFADLDAFDIEVDTEDADALIAVVRHIGATFGGVNLEDISSPDCFRIEAELQDLLDVPVFHDDQHGTAIICSAGLLNACEVTGRRIEDVKLVLCGAGAAGLGSITLMKALGVRAENTTLVDVDGVVYCGRTTGMDQWKAVHATNTPHRTLAEALVDADVFIGVSAKGVLTKDMVASMAANPIIFAMANPDPEITPEEVLEVRQDAIMATGRSDYPNQVNNILGFPYIFRGALDVQARSINHEMKVAAARALAMLAREDVPDEVALAYQGRQLRFGRDYIIPSPFDPRLIWYVPPFIAEAAMATGVARRPIADMDAYRASLRRRLDPSAGFLQAITASVQAAPMRRVVFIEGEEPSVIRAAYAFAAEGLGIPILLGREDVIRRNTLDLGLEGAAQTLETVNARLSGRNGAYAEFLYQRLQRRGYLRRDVERLINTDRQSFAAVMVALGDADALVTGVTRNFDQCLNDVSRAITPAPGGRLMGLSVMLVRGRTVFVADTSICELPTAEDLVAIAREAASAVRRLGHEPRVAFLSSSSFGHPHGEQPLRVRRAVELMDEQSVDFQYEGEMPPDVALDASLWANYPFQRLTEPANLLIMPAIHSATISTKLVQALGGATVVGPILFGLSKPVQICRLGDSVTAILTMATLAAFQARHP